MTPLPYFSAFRRRWPVLVACVAIAVAAAAAVWSRAPAARTKNRPFYSASAILLGSGTRGVGNLETLAALVNVGTVPERVAARLGHNNPITLTRRVQVSSDTRTGLLTITAAGPASRGVEELANAFAEELLRFAAEERQKELEAQMSLLDVRREQLEDQMTSLEDRLRTAGRQREEEIRLRIEQWEQEIQGIEASRDQIAGAAAYQAGPQLIQRARSVQVSSSSSPAADSSSRRYAVAALFGFFLGSALLLVLERFDSRIRTKSSAEDAFDLPVLTEVPVLSRRRRRNAATIVTAAPTSLAADAHRLLALQLDAREDRDESGDAASTQASEGEESLVAASSRATAGSLKPTRPNASVEAGAAPPPPGPRRTSTILVTSPGRGDGKTTVAANLAAALTEMGQKVVVLSWDFHRPKLDAVLGLPTEAIEHSLSNGNGRIRGHIVTSNLDDLQIGVIPSRASGDRLDEMRNSDRMESLLAEAKEAADVVIIDTAPLLDASDAAPLASRVDAVVVVARAGKTTAAQAERTTELLRQLSARVRGVVLNRVKEISIWAPGRRIRR